MVLSKKILNEIDENMREIIDILNRKGYITIMCCEGHSPNYNGYILFTHNYDFNPMPPSFVFFNNKRTIINFNTELNKEATIAELLKWANELPKRRLKTDFVYVLLGKSKRTNQLKTLYYGSKKYTKDFIKEKSKYYYDFIENKLGVEKY